MRRSLALRRTAAALALPMLLALTSCASDSDEPEDSQSSAAESTPGDDSETPDEGDDARSGADAKGEPDKKSVDGDPDSSGGKVSPLTTLDAEKGEVVDGKTFAAIARWALDNGTTAKLKLETTAQGGVSGSGSIDHTTSPVSMLLTIEAAGRKADMRLVDGAMYIPIELPGGTKYQKADLTGVAGGMDLSGLDPSHSLRQGLAKKKFTYRGEESVDGAPAQRFSTGNVDIWFDDAGLLRRIRTTKGDDVTTGTYSDWGTDVEITAPPADQVIEQPTLPNAPKS